MGKSLLFLIAILGMITTEAFGHKSDCETVNITTKELLMLADSGVLLVDVRTPQEYAEGHIREAVNIDMLEPDFLMRMDKLDKTKPIIIYCRSGNRSSRAVQQLQSLHFKKIYHYPLGWNGWLKEKR